MNPMITPIANLNGNTPESLLDQLRGVMTAIHALDKACSAASDCWHGRNFQTLKDGQLAQRDAQQAWMDRFDWLRQFHDEVLTMALEVQGQKHEPTMPAPRGWDKVEGGIEKPWHISAGDSGEVFVGVGDRHVFIINEGPDDFRQRMAKDLVDKLNKMTAMLVLPTLYEKGNDTQGALGHMPDERGTGPGETEGDC